MKYPTSLKREKTNDRDCHFNFIAFLLQIKTVAVER